MAVSAATGLFAPLGRMGVPPLLAGREGADQGRTSVWKLPLLAAVTVHAQGWRRHRSLVGPRCAGSESNGTGARLAPEPSSRAMAVSHFAPGVLRLAKQTIANFIEKASRLYEQERRAGSTVSPLEMYVRRWLRWARGGVAVVRRVLCARHA